MFEDRILLVEDGSGESGSPLGAIYLVAALGVSGSRFEWCYISCEVIRTERWYTIPSQTPAVGELMELPGFLWQTSMQDSRCCTPLGKDVTRSYPSYLKDS